MRITFLAFSLCILYFPVKGQSCSECFIDEVKKSFQNAIPEFHNYVEKSDVYTQGDSLKILYIPLVFVTKKGAKLYSKKAIDKSELLCYLDGEKIEFEESFLYKKTCFWGLVSRSKDSNGIHYEYSNNSSDYGRLLKPIAKELINVQPEFVFRIYNLPECYWYIKKNELFVINYTHCEMDIQDIKTMTANDFIDNHLEQEDLIFLFHKRVEVISGVH